MKRKILLEYCERTGHLHHNDGKVDPNTNGYVSLCNNITTELGLEFGEYLYKYADSEKPSFEETKALFESFLLT